MLSITLPEEDAGSVFAACAVRTQDIDRRNALLAQRPQVERRSALYLLHARHDTLHDFDPVDPDNIAPAELSGLYNRVLVKGGERELYLKLRGRSPYNRCPLCAQRDVKTLDHHLSRDDYPELAVVPGNLTPSCFECNHAKHNYRAETADDRLFHPYFDDWSRIRLLRATVTINARVSVDYDIRTPPDVDIQTVRRAQRHLRELDLDSLYAQHAAVELVQRKLTFQSTFATDGAEGLKADLALDARSRRRSNINSWQSALYRALSQSDAFCDQGFECIEEP